LDVFPKFFSGDIQVSNLRYNTTPAYFVTISAVTCLRQTVSTCLIAVCLKVKCRKRILIPSVLPG